MTVLGSGILSPGASIESLAVGATTFASGSVLEFTDLASSATAFPQGTKFSLISYGNNSWDGGLFTYQGNELANLETFSAGLNQWEIRYDDPIGGSNFTGDQLVGSSVTITAVPVPASLAVAAIGCGALAIALRRRGRIARS